LATDQEVLDHLLLGQLASDFGGHSGLFEIAVSTLLLSSATTVMMLMMMAEAVVAAHHSLGSQNGSPRSVH
jgi:hypothetical protein